nr:DUF11 domain-containing protein [Clostridiales bacterium]
VYQPGETVTFDLTVTNINPTDTISGIRFEWYPYLNNGDTAETPVEVAMPDLKLLPGESYTLEHAFSYTVTTSDAKRGFTVMEFIAWCHSTTFDWWSNCGWHGLVRTEPDSKKGLSLKVTLSPSSIYYIGKAEWKPVNSADSETTNFMGLESATYSGETTVSDAAVKNGDEWIQYPGPDNPAPAIPACITITNQTDAPVTATITSDHPGDIIDWNLPVPPTVPSNGSVTVDYWIYPEPEEIDTGRLERYITAAIPEFPEPLDEYISIHFNPENGIALPAESGPGISLVCTGVTPVWNEEEQKNRYEAYMKVTNTGNMPLSLDAWFVDSHNSVTKDTLAMWDESDKKAFFAPNDELEFVYIIHEQNRDKDEESIRRTLHITGYAYDTGETVMDSTSFVFPCSHTDLLDLALTGYQRLTDPDQTIIANLRLTNRGEETLTGIKFDIRDVNGNIVPEDQFIGVSKEASYSLVPGEYMEFRAKIHPTEDDFEETDVVRTISAVDASASVEDEVYLRLCLKTDKVDNAILYLEGELTGPESLGLGEEFGAHLTAWNYGNMDLEDVTVECTIQSPSGNVLFKKNYVVASSLFAPGQSCNTWPIIAITEQMVINALANVPLKDNEPNTLTFIFSAHGILRSVYSASPICSNQVTFTIHIEHESGIDVSIDSDIPKQSPKAGEPLNIPLIIQNVGRDDLRGLRLEVSKLVGDTYIFMDTLIDNPYEVIHPGDTRSYVFPYVVGNDDAEKGNIGFSFKAIASSSVFDEAMKDTCEYSTDLTPQPVRDLLLTKTVTNTPPEGQAAYRLSDEVHYTITATNNTGVDLYDVEIYDDVDGYSTMFLLDRINLAAGESVDIPFIRVVCPYDVDQKQILNTARAYYMIDPPFELSAESNTVRTPVEDVLDVEQGVFIRKARANNSLDPKGYALNEQIDYDITVFNSSDTDVEVDIWDYVWSTEAPELVAQVTLAPNEIQSFSHFYKVREVDLPPTPDVTGLVTNEAFAGVRVYDGQGNILTGYTVWSLPVEAKTIRTANPEKKDPPVTEKPTVTPKPQTGGGESCRRVLTGYGSVGAEYDLLFCTKHSMLETVTRKLSAAEAVSVWTDAVNSSYEALAEKVSTETAAFVQIDQLLFTQQLEAYQTMLTDAFGEEKAAEVILQHLRERCNDLCYALHHAPETRPDSILRTDVPVLSAQGERASHCGRTIEPIPGGYHVTETVCKTHDFILSGLNLRLSGASIEEKASRFDETRQLWMSLLMKKANELYAGQSQEGKASTSASLNLFQGWLNARRNVLLALYPHDPSVAAELLSNTVHTRMLDLDVLMP